MEKKDWIIIILFVLGVGTFVLSYLEKWVNIQFKYFVSVLVIGAVIFLALNYKMSKTFDWNEAREISKVVLVKKGIISEDEEPRVKWFALRKDKPKLFGGSHMWDFEILDEKGNHNAVFIDSKSGEVKAGAFNIDSRNPPTEWDKEEFIFIPTDKRHKKRKVNIEEEFGGEDGG